MKLRLIITEQIVEKLKDKHRVLRSDIAQCFANRTGGFLEDIRENHQTDPPTRWFISENDAGRSLKIVFVRSDDFIFIKTAHEPNEDESRIYAKYGVQ